MIFGIEWIGKTLLLLLCVRSVPKEPLMLKGKEGVRVLMILMTTIRMSLKMKRIKLHLTMRAGLRQGEKGVVEVSE